jgi:hypothetical protein
MLDEQCLIGVDKTRQCLLRAAWPCHGSGGQSPASHCLAPGHSIWDLCWTKWHWDRFSLEFFGFHPLISFNRGFILTYHLQDEQQAPFRDTVSLHQHEHHGQGPPRNRRLFGGLSHRCLPLLIPTGDCFGGCHKGACPY